MVVFLFLYLPILLLIVYSFNASETISVWDGFSFTWYQSLWQNRPLLEATKNSLLIASATTVLSVFIGKRPGNCISPNPRDLGTMERCERRKSLPIHSG